MKKTLLLITIVSVCIILQSNSTSSVEYRLMHDHASTEILSVCHTINEALDEWLMMFSAMTKDKRWSASTQHEKTLTEKIIGVQTTLVALPDRSAAIPFLFELIILLMISVIFTIFSIGAFVSIILDGLLAALMVILVGFIMYVIEIIGDGSANK
jgi:hypothetical protein